MSCTTTDLRALVRKHRGWWPRWAAEQPTPRLADRAYGPGALRARETDNGPAKAAHSGWLPTYLTKPFIPFNTPLAYFAAVPFNLIQRRNGKYPQ